MSQPPLAKSSSPVLNMGSSISSWGDRGEGGTGIDLFIVAMLHWEQGRSQEAFAELRRARALLPFNDRIRRAEIDWLVSSGSMPDAIECALGFDRDFGPVEDSRYVLATLYLRTGQWGQAQTWFDRALNSPVQPSPSRMLPAPLVSPARLIHDREQLEYLMRSGRLSTDYQFEVEVLAELLERLFGVNLIFDSEVRADRVALLSPRELASLSRVYKRVVAIEPVGRLECRALGNRMFDSRIERDYLDSRSDCRHVVVDDFLSSECLKSLSEYCLNSWIWLNDDQKGRAYLGAYQHNGFHTPLIDQIDGELRRCLPTVLRNMRLRQVWSYRNVLGSTGIGVHADFAEVNVNFWLTHEDMNLKRDRGGLLLYPVARPVEWEFERYNGSEEEIRSLLLGHEPVSIPFKQNRAVIFDSALFHGSDQPEFRQAFEARRTNITFLYG